MSKYKNDNYQKAADKYTELQEQYTGEKGTENVMQTAQKGGAEVAAQAGNAAGASAAGAARSAGMSRAQAALTGANIAAAKSADAYQNAYSNTANLAQQNNQNALTAQSNQVQWGKAQDDTKYQNENAWYGNLLKAGGDIAGAALSDEKKKDIKVCTDTEARRKELLEKLRG